jgi:lambda family phage minor tail protein L
MSTSLSIASIIEKNRISSEVPWLILLDIAVVDPATLLTVETLHLARNVDPVTFNGVTYAPAAFDISLKSEAGSQQEISLSIKDYTLAVQQKMQDYGGGIGFNVTVMVVNAGNLGQNPEVAEYFQVTAAETANYECSFTLGAENNITKAFPRRRQSKDYCQWRYKGPECGYTGSMPSCDLSLKGPNGCKAHQNVVHFGAFPGINSRDFRYG